MASARQHGFSFVEIMVAVALLAICALPMAEAIRNGLMASAVGVEKAQELRCMRNTMETIMAEPYHVLWEVADAAAWGRPVTYALPIDASCDGIGRVLSIILCEQCTGEPVALSTTVEASRRQSAMLAIRLSSDKGYSFEALVSR